MHETAKKKKESGASPRLCFFDPAREDGVHHVVPLQQEVLLDCVNKGGGGGAEMRNHPVLKRSHS